MGTGDAERLGGDASTANVERIAAEGTTGAGKALPHLDWIQAAFGGHDVRGIQAHVGGPAAVASERLQATAYASGNDVAFKESPSLHTAAHEAAHVVQQRAGVHLKGGLDTPGDSYERHADAVADAVVAGQSAEGLLGDIGAGGGGRAVQRQEAPPPGGAVMRSPQPAAAADHATAAPGSGSALPDSLRGKFESSLGADLSGVRIHAGEASATAADAVSAKAYTVGNDIHFAAGEYNPSSRAGEQLLAHEVAHTVQQAGSVGHAPQYKLEVSTPGDAAEVEADRSAEAMVAGRPAAVQARGAGVMRTPQPGAAAQTSATPAPAAAPAHAAAPAAGAHPGAPAVSPEVAHTIAQIRTSLQRLRNCEIGEREGHTRLIRIHEGLGQGGEHQGEVQAGVDRLVAHTSDAVANARQSVGESVDRAANTVNRWLHPLASLVHDHPRIVAAASAVGTVVTAPGAIAANVATRVMGGGPSAGPQAPQPHYIDRNVQIPPIEMWEGVEASLHRANVALTAFQASPNQPSLALVQTSVEAARTQFETCTRRVHEYTERTQHGAEIASTGLEVFSAACIAIGGLVLIPAMAAAATGVAAGAAASTTAVALTTGAFAGATTAAVGGGQLGARHAMGEHISGHDLLDVVFDVLTASVTGVVSCLLSGPLTQRFTRALGGKLVLAASESQLLALAERSGGSATTRAVAAWLETRGRAWLIDRCTNAIITPINTAVGAVIHLAHQDPNHHMTVDQFCDQVVHDVMHPDVIGMLLSDTHHHIGHAPTPGAPSAHSNEPAQAPAAAAPHETPAEPATSRGATPHEPLPRGPAPSEFSSPRPAAAPAEHVAPMGPQPAPLPPLHMNSPEPAPPLAPLHMNSPEAQAAIARGQAPAHPYEHGSPSDWAAGLPETPHAGAASAAPAAAPAAAHAPATAHANSPAEVPLASRPATAEPHGAGLPPVIEPGSYRPTDPANLAGAAADPSITTPDLGAQARAAQAHAELRAAPQFVPDGEVGPTTRSGSRVGTADEGGVLASTVRGLQTRSGQREIAVSANRNAQGNVEPGVSAHVGSESSCAPPAGSVMIAHSHPGARANEQVVFPSARDGDIGHANDGSGNTQAVVHDRGVTVFSARSDVSDHDGMIGDARRQHIERRVGAGVNVVPPTEAVPDVIIRHNAQGSAELYPANAQGQEITGEGAHIPIDPTFRTRNADGTPRATDAEGRGRFFEPGTGPEHVDALRRHNDESRRAALERDHGAEEATRILRSSPIELQEQQAAHEQWRQQQRTTEASLETVRARSNDRLTAMSDRLERAHSHALESDYDNAHAAVQDASTPEQLDAANQRLNAIDAALATHGHPAPASGPAAPSHEPITPETAAATAAPAAERP